jgi:hypothetical protein
VKVKAVLREPKPQVEAEAADDVNDMKRLVSLLAVASLLCLGTYSLEAVDHEISTTMHLHVVELRAERAPEIYEDSLIFSSALKARFVGVAFEHEGFAKIHSLEKNKYGIFFFIYQIPRGMSEPIRYRFVADGVWGTDRANPRVENDYAAGCKLSVVSIPLLSTEKPGVYRLLDAETRVAHFRFRASPNETVTVAGTFNQWDPCMYEMSEVEPGLYELDLELPAGRQCYCFVYRGSKCFDKLNPSTAYSPEGEKVSALFVP